MRVTQVTRATEGRLSTWYAAAVNDPTVEPFLSFESWHAEFKMTDDDWSGAFFMDLHNRGVMRVSFDTQMPTAAVGIWVLDRPERPLVAALLIRHLVRVVAPRRGFDAVDFSIAATNRTWLAQFLTRDNGAYCWGIEPRGAVLRGVTVPVHRFLVPLDRVLRRGD